MKRLCIILTMVLFVCCTHTDIDDDSHTSDEKAITRTEINDELDYESLSALFEEDVRILDESDTTSKLPTLSFVQTGPFIHSQVLALDLNPDSISGIIKILIIVESSIYEQMGSKINRYANDIATVYGCAVFVESVSGGSHKDIKTLILSYKNNLNGTVFIGDIPAAYFEIEDDHYKYGYRKWPCDLYYMDLNGTWTDSDGNDIYDIHTGDILPEIFVGRISAKNMGNLTLEIDGLNMYFDKNHNFWKGNTTINHKAGLSYVDKDWASLSSHRTDIQYLYGGSNYESKFYGNESFGKGEYLSCLRNDKYEFVHLSCHASPTYLAMSGNFIWANEIYNNGTNAIGYNLFCCSACNWTASSINGYLAGAHIYNHNEKSLVVVGSTKTGSMLDFKYFYTPLGQGKTIGEALKAWWSTTAQKSEHMRISWFYGMTVIGDPMINFWYDSAVNEITLNGFNAMNTDIMAKRLITVNNYNIPAKTHVIFKAPEVTLNLPFTCNRDGTFEIVNEI